MTAIVLSDSIQPMCEAATIAHIAAEPFDYALRSIQLVRKAEKPVRTSSSPQDKGQSTISGLQLLVGVLQQGQDYRPLPMRR